MKPIFKKRVGCEEIVTISFDNRRWYRLTASMDTKNSLAYPIIGATIAQEDDKHIRFVVQADDFTSDGLREECLNIEGKVLDTNGLMHPFVRCAYIKIGNRTLENTYVVLVDQHHEKTKASMNINLMSELKFVVDPSIKYRF